MSKMILTSEHASRTSREPRKVENPPASPQSFKYPDRDGRCLSMSRRCDGISHDIVWAMAAIFALCVVLMAGQF